MNSYELKQKAQNVLEQAFEDPHPVRRKAHLQMLNAMVTFHDKVRRYEHILAHPEQFERLPPAKEEAVRIR